MGEGSGIIIRAPEGIVFVRQINSILMNFLYFPFSGCLGLRDFPFRDEL